MSWEAANVPKVGEWNTAETGDGDPINGTRHSRSIRGATSETVEAALSRLSKAYKTSMECIGAIHKMDQMILREQQKEENQLFDSDAPHRAMIHRVAIAARKTLESNILVDPLILPHIPTLRECMMDLSLQHEEEEDFRWNFVQDRRPVPTIISSEAHKSTLIQLAYLSLVNYTDLLQSICHCYSSSRYNDRTSILDRGIVPKYKSLVKQTGQLLNGDGDAMPIGINSCADCCWQPEIPEETHRLAVAALCDASNLHYASDPVLWLKLGCASRCLERIIAVCDPTTVVRSHHRRLQRHALERGSVALPSHMPPNRTILRALAELLQEPEPTEYISRPIQSHQVNSKTLDLPRYSWSVLGRMLIRACTGEEVTSLHGTQRARQGQHCFATFGSVRLGLHLSPMLVVPQRVLGKVCQYLENSSIWKLEATCRALSVALVSARASMKEQEGMDTQRNAKLMQRRTPNPRVAAGDRSNSRVSSAGSNVSGDANESHEGNEAAQEPPRPNSRSSKRLLSQRQSSEKRHDREKNRNSFSYCFLAATLSYTQEQHMEMIKELKGGKHVAHLLEGSESQNPASQNCKSGVESSSGFLKKHRTEAIERLSDASLPSFIRRWSSENAGPMDLLKNFLCHVSIHVEDVFSSDPGAAGTLGLASCIISCFELLLTRTGSRQSIAPRFYESPSQNCVLFRSLEGFSMDLLYAELILRECDRNTPQVVDFDDDENIVSIMVPSLIAARNDLKSHIDERKDGKMDKVFGILQTRCYWVIAVYYLWRSRIATEVYVAREAEDEGTFFIGQAINSFDFLAMTGITKIRTPHLVSPGRQEHHWKELSPDSLSKFRDEIQASSVVSTAKQQFQELLREMEVSAGHDELPDAISPAAATTFVTIGEKLFGRYRSAYGSPDSKLNELIHNFLLLHGDRGLRDSMSETGAQRSLRDGDDTMLLPLTPLRPIILRRFSNPSTLSLLFVCMSMDPTNQLSLIRLLIDLIRTTYDLHDSLMIQILHAKSMRRRNSPGYNSDDDGISDSDDDSITSSDFNGRRNDDVKKARQCGQMSKFLLDTIADSLHTTLSKQERADLMFSEEFLKMVDASMSFSNKWYCSILKPLSISDDVTDQSIFQSVSNLLNEISNLLNEGLEDPKASDKIVATFFQGMVRIVTSQTTVLRSLTFQETDRSNRSSKQRSCVRRSEFVSMVASQLGDLLSKNLACVKNGELEKSWLFGSSNFQGLTRHEQVLFVEAVRWLLKFSTQAVEENANTSAELVCSSFDRPSVKELRIPVCTLVVGLCGSAATSRDGVLPNDDPLGLNELYDTDASVNDWNSNLGPVGGIPSHRKKELLRVICNVVYCIAVTLDSLDDKDSVKRFLGRDCTPRFGPLLPLICSRVLNLFSSALLENFGVAEGSDTNRLLLWAKTYPYRTQDVGEYLDSLLHKVYRWLYGFVLVGEWDHVQSSGKDFPQSMSSIFEISRRGFVPESTTAAAQLYRCIVRAYAGGRRTPPKAALELVSAALPPQRESERSKTLRQFVFSSSSMVFTLRDAIALVERSDKWDAPFLEISDTIMEKSGSSDGARLSFDESEAMHVRRGLSARLAAGPLPDISSDMGQKSDSKADDDRATCSRMEEELSKMFNAIFDDICLSEAENCKGWYRAAQCLSMKADVIADRLGLSLGFARIKRFSVPAKRKSTDSGVIIQDLLEEQRQEEEVVKKNRIGFLGDDLTPYIKHCWSSYPSLRRCAECVQSDLQGAKSFGNAEKAFSCAVLQQIENYRENRAYLRWQESWGGIFVAALRELSLRFMGVALYMLQSKSKKKESDSVLMSEICEAIGVCLYAELMSSQRYGWPMNRLPVARKRKIAEAAKKYFQTAADIVENSSGNGDDSQDRATWDLLFMVGKCNEKIAGTYERESYAKNAEGTPTQRLYEKCMESALQTYADALEQAQKIEEDGGQLADQAGGSSHGTTEVLYRLHALRLKCLIHAVTRDAGELNDSELEALRLTERYWFNQDATTTPKEVRDRVWKVFTDIVEGLVECRKMQPYFHRSVYRHAQALMWSPVLNDPRSSAGSMSTVPATRSFTIRGLNNSTPAAVSAGVIMSKLFDKKRSQLCAVWVTTNTASSPFQILNTAIRKYDSLRGKYIAAYLEAMHVDSRRAEIETLMKWIYGSKRDVLSYFQASAINGGDKPAKNHPLDPLLETSSALKTSLLYHKGLLTESKRNSNSSLADILIREMRDKLGNDGNSKQSLDSRKKVAESYLKHSYACYLRLNCSRDDLSKSRAFKYGGESVREVEAVCQAYLYFGGTEALSSTDFGDWSGGSGQKAAIFDAAIAKCKEIFPSLSGNFFSKKGTSKSTQDEEGVSGKRKEAPVNLVESLSPQGTKNVSFEVAVPKGLTAGDTFYSSVKVGNGDPIKVKLTVPSGKPSTLRFNLDVPKSSTRKITKKTKLSL